MSATVIMNDLDVILKEYPDDVNEWEDENLVMDRNDPGGYPIYLASMTLINKNPEQVMALTSFDRSESSGHVYHGLWCLGRTPLGNHNRGINSLICGFLRCQWRMPTGEILFPDTELRHILYELDDRDGYPLDLGVQYHLRNFYVTVSTGFTDYDSPVQGVRISIRDPDAYICESVRFEITRPNRIASMDTFRIALYDILKKFFLIRPMKRMRSW